MLLRAPWDARDVSAERLEGPSVRRELMAVESYVPVQGAVALAARQQIQQRRLARARRALLRRA